LVCKNLNPSLVIPYELSNRPIIVLIQRHS